MDIKRFIKILSISFGVILISFGLYLHNNNVVDDHVQINAKLFNEMNQLGFPKEFEITDIKTVYEGKNNRILLCEIKTNNNTYYNSLFLSKYGWHQVSDNKFIKDRSELSLRTYADKVQLKFTMKLIK